MTAGRRASTRRRGWVGGMAALVLAVLLLAGCGLVNSLVDTTTGLRKAGFSQIRVGLLPGANARSDVGVSVGVTVDAPPTDDVARVAARVVWDDFRERFGVLEVVVHGHGPALHRRYAYAQMVAIFGSRNPAYDKTSVTSSVKGLGRNLLAGLAVVVVAVGAVVAVVLLRRRKRGPPPPRPPGAGGPGWGSPAPPGG